MNIKKSTLNNLLMLVGAIVVVVIVFVLISSTPIATSDAAVPATIDANGNQLMELSAHWGYKPGVITAKANTASILRVTTEKTLDCSTSLRIPSLNVTKVLPTTGTTDIAIPAQAAGTTLQGTCTMGMYHFQIKFI